MTRKQVPGDAWPLLASWILASAIGWAGGLAAGAMLTLVAERYLGLNGDRVLAYVTLPSLGLATGIAQWRVMLPYLARPARWVAATLVGYLLGLVPMAIGPILYRLLGTGLWDDVLLLSLLGAAIGTAQWWILRRHFDHTALWVLATAVGFQCLLWIIANPSHSLAEYVIRGAIVGALAAAVPGATLVWLVGQPLAAGSEGAA